MPDLPKAYTPHDVEGAIYERWLAADVFAPDGAGSTADPAAPAVHHHPAAAQHHRLAPPRPCPAHRRRGPDDPARPDARPSGALPARARPRLDRRPVRPRRHPRQGRREPPVARARALPRADARVRGDDARGHARPAAAGRGVGRLGPPALHDGRALGEGRPGRLRAALPGRPRLSHRGARQLVPGLPDERERSRGRLDAGDRDALVGALPPHRPGDRPARPGRDDHRRHDPAGDDPRRHRGGRPPRRSALRGARRADGPHPVRRARRPDHRRRDRGPGVRHRGRQDHARPRPRRPRDRASPRPARADHPRRRRDDRRDRDALRRDGPLRGANGDRRRPRGARRPGRRDAARDGHRALPAQQRRHRAAAQDAVVHPDRAARGTRARGDPLRPDPDPPGAVREDLGALAHGHPRLERLAPAVVGPPHPGLVLPRRPRDGHVGGEAGPTPARSAAGPPRSSARIRTSSTRGSARGSGRSRRSAGPTTPTTTGPTTRPR